MKISKELQILMEIQDITLDEAYPTPHLAYRAILAKINKFFEE